MTRDWAPLNKDQFPPDPPFELPPDKAEFYRRYDQATKLVEEIRGLPKEQRGEAMRGVKEGLSEGSIRPKRGDVDNPSRRSAPAEPRQPRAARPKSPMASVRKMQRLARIAKGTRRRR